VNHLSATHVADARLARGGAAEAARARRVAFPRAEFPVYAPVERRADAAVHALGLALGLAGCVLLAATVPPRADPSLRFALALYMAGLMAMFGCSALYNLAHEVGRKRLLRRFDQAAIFLMIAGTYTPVALVSIGGAWGVGLLAFVWSAAVGGMTVKLLALRCPEWLSVALYLLLGWSVVVAFEPLAAAVPTATLLLLAAGGVLYSVGVIFHLWLGLPHHNAIWHGFVLAGATCHWWAIVREVAAG
jgi:hemolysin III